MVNLRCLGLVLAFSLLSLKGLAQSFKNFHTKSFKVIKDTVVLDSLSLVPGSLRFSFFPKEDSTNVPIINYQLHALIFKTKKPDSIKVTYQRFPYNLEKNYFHKDKNDLYTDITRRANPFTITYTNTSNRDNLFTNDGLNKNGNISRGISFGNSQDVVVNSNLNLQVSGKLTPEIDLMMAATDNNLPFQADGTTAQLQEFDKVFIQLNNSNTKLIVGDYQLSRPQNSYFMNFYKRAQGIYLENVYKDSTAKLPLIFKTQVSGAVSRGKFSRQVFFGVESNQGPYRLRGAENETFIIILSGTEKIYIDGRLMQRGQENDYIIDYNTGEITFTARQLITKDKRIVTEFQYAERNYARSLFFFGEEIEAKRTKAYFNFFTEQDNKNRPLQQELGQAQKDVMIEAGDSLNKAVYSGVKRINKSDFNNSDVFYKKIDTTVSDRLYKNIYVYSSNSDTARYRIQFSNVGQNRGNYRQINSAANGKVFMWVAPVSGIPQGNYDTIIPLVTPRQNQMLTAGVQHSFTPNNSLGVEGVYTKNNINVFSTKDRRNDEGSGLRVLSRNQTILKIDSTKDVSKVIYNFSYEFLQQRFKQIERFRSIEFDRDWNRPLTGVLASDQHLGSMELGYVKNKKKSINYNLSAFDEGIRYRGLKNNVLAAFENSSTKFSYSGSFLNTQDRLNFQSTQFYRHKSLISRKVEKIKLSYSDEFENNRFINSRADNLLPRSYQFWEWEGSVSNADSSKNSVKLFYRERRDKLAYSNDLKDSTFATNVGLRTSIYSVKNNPFTILITFRKLDLTRNLVGKTLKPDNTLLNRLEYNPRYFKGLITAGFFYETGYGLENKREFYYLEVAPGQGQFAWRDYNANGIKELNEFEIALFNDQARYIRIYTPTNQYIKVLQNQLSISLSVRPAELLKKSTKKMARFAKLWVLQTALRLDNKISEFKGKEAYNPFFLVKDTFLIASNNNIRQSVFFNQASPYFGADYTYINNKSRQLLTNGIEGRKLESHEVKWRYNFAKAWSVNSDNVYSLKGNSSQFFNNRNFLIKAFETEQKLIFQPNTVFRISAIYKYNEKRNDVKTEATEQAFLNTYAFELKYNQTDKGSLTSRFDFIQIKYNASENSSVAYEMLNGLNKGNNFTWELVYQRNLNNNIQISINYNGRKSTDSPIVHLGGAQIRAYF
jgi:hypothetical protein